MSSYLIGQKGINKGSCRKICIGGIDNLNYSTRDSLLSRYHWTIVRTTDVCRLVSVEREVRYFYSTAVPPIKSKLL